MTGSRTTLRGVARAALLAMVLTGAAVAEEVDFRVPATCLDLPLSLGALSLTFLEDGVQMTVPVAIALTAHASGVDFTLTGLPDVAAGTSTRRALSWEACKASFLYVYPQQTRTPQALVFAQTFVTTAKARVAVGDTLPVPTLQVKGLSSDPTGSAVTFTMVTRIGATPAVLDGPAVISDIDQATDLSWEATLTYNWAAVDTATPGNYRAWFTVTLPVASCGPAGSDPCVSTFPPDRTVDVHIFSK